MELTAQIIGYVAMVIIIISYLIKNQKTFFLLQLISCVLFAISYFMMGVGDATAMICCGMTISTVITSAILIFKKTRKKWYTLVILLVALAGIYGGIYANVYDKLGDKVWVSWLLLAGQAISVAYLWYDNANITRILRFFIVSPIWLINNWTIGAWGAVTCEFFNFASIIGYWVMQYLWKRRRNYDALIIDLDGTTIDSFDSYFENLKSLAKKYNLKEPTLELAKEGFPLTIKPILKIIFDVEGPEWEQRFRENKFEIYKKQLKAYPNAYEVLNQFVNRGGKIAIASNQSHKSMIICSNIVKFSEFIDVYVGADDVKNPKPCGDHILEAMRKLHIKDPKRCLYLGDSSADLIASKDAHMDVALATYSMTPANVPGVEPEYYFDNMKDLNSILYKRLTKIKKLVDVENGEKTPFKTTLKYGVKHGIASFEFNCKDSKYYAPYKGVYNEKHYLGDVVEIFIGSAKDKNTYFEIEVTPENDVFLAKIHYVQDENDKFHLETEFIKDNFLRTSVTKFKDGYKVNIEFKLENVNTGNGIFYFNAYRIETEGGTPEKNLLALNPTGKRAFHVPSKFIRL